MEFWNSLIILKEIKKSSDKFLRVWAKNQLRFGVFEKILNLHTKLSMEVIFTHFLSHLPGLLWFYTPLQPFKIGDRGGVVLLRAWVGTF